MGRLAIRRLKYWGECYHYESPYFYDGLNIVEGENGHGKTTFMNLLYFGLGGSVESFQKEGKNEHVQIFRDKNNFIQLEIQINDEIYILKRFIKSNDIYIESQDGQIEILPIFRNEEKEIFSDWILKKLGIAVIDLFQGTRSWKINFVDLLRLIYHNQAPDPRKIYKEPDSDNFITDSVVVRRAIFELLLGKTFQEYYSAFGKYKDAEKRRNITKETISVFVEISNEIKNSDEDLNLSFLTERKKEREKQLNKLINYRESLKNRESIDIDANSSVDCLKAQLIDAELKYSEFKTDEFELLDEIAKIRNLKHNTIDEVAQLKKILFAHERLNLFSPDTCPYCLKKVERKKNHCVCGTVVAEDEYEMFFYSSDEYLDILKSKQKSVETIDIALEECILELKNIRESRDDLQGKIADLRSKIKELVNSVDCNVNVANLNEIDDKILEVRKEIQNIQQEIELETKRDELEVKLSVADAEFKSAKLKADELYSNANIEMQKQINLFSEKYNLLMRDTVKDCRNASIDDDYMPIINGGEYKESSADVPKRLMYYLTLLYLSIKDLKLTFPRLLLIDTPETAGIDAENLNRSISKITDITNEDGLDSNYQIILTTGIKKYPVEFKDSVVETLFANSKLLKKNIVT